MKHILVYFTLAASAMAAQAPAKKPASKASARSAAKPAVRAAPAKPAVSAAPAKTGVIHSSPAAPQPRAEIPAGAVEFEPGTWRHVDSQGNVWHYRKTPFGLSKFRPEDVKADTQRAAVIRAFDEGDTVRFERETPFGAAKWTRQKSELNAEELAAFKNAAEPRPAPTPAAAKAASKE